MIQVLDDQACFAACSGRASQRQSATPGVATAAAAADVDAASVKAGGMFSQEQLNQVLTAMGAMQRPPLPWVMPQWSGMPRMPFLADRFYAARTCFFGDLGHS